MEWLAGGVAVAILFFAIRFLVQRPPWRKPDASLPPNEPWRNYQPTPPTPPPPRRRDPKEPIP